MSKLFIRMKGNNTDSPGKLEVKEYLTNHGHIIYLKSWTMRNLQK